MKAETESATSRKGQMGGFGVLIVGAGTAVIIAAVVAFVLITMNSSSSNFSAAGGSYINTGLSVLTLIMSFLTVVAISVLGKFVINVFSK